MDMFSLALKDFLQDSGGKRHHNPQQLEHSSDGYADQPKGQQAQPDQRIQHEGEEGQRPTKD
jgi:hypothetical protein